jgi:cyclase
MFYSAAPIIFQRAKELRNQLTDAERTLWMHLRMKPRGCKFRRQHPAGNYILDFYCHALKIAIEWMIVFIMKKEFRKQITKGKKNLEAEGICMIRFSNKDVMTNMKDVTEQINISIDKRQLTQSVTERKRRNDEC